MRYHVSPNCKRAQMLQVRSLVSCLPVSARYNSEAVSPSMRAGTGKRRFRPRKDGVSVTAYSWYPDSKKNASHLTIHLKKQPIEQHNIRVYKKSFLSVSRTMMLF